MQINLANHKSYLFKNIILPKKEKITDNNYFKLSFKNDTLSIKQEYGGASPEGWYVLKIYYNIKRQDFFIYDVTDNQKNFDAINDNDFLNQEKKKINKSVTDFSWENCK